MASERERYRRELERQLRADVEMLVAAYRAKLRAYDLLAQLRGEAGEDGSWPPLDVSFGPLPEAAPGPFPPAAQPASAAAAQRRKRYKPSEVQNAAYAAFRKVGDLFVTDDLIQAMGFTPHRATLNRILLDLQHDGYIDIARRGTGQQATRYRKLVPAVAVSTPDASDGG
jgi:hypothetical protein